MTDLVRAWERIEAWLREHRCTRALTSLHPPASEDAFQSLQDAIPYPLHPDLVQWLRIHGGAPLYDAPVWPGGHVPYDVDVLAAGPEYMEEMFEEFSEQRAEDPEHWVQGPWADPLWLPIAGTNTGESLLIDHRPGATYGSVIEIDYEGNEVTAVRWRSLGEMVRLMAESLESGLPMPYSRQYVRVPRLDEGPPRSLDWRLEKIAARCDGPPSPTSSWPPGPPPPVSAPAQTRPRRPSRFPAEPPPPPVTVVPRPRTPPPPPFPPYPPSPPVGPATG